MSFDPAELLKGRPSDRREALVEKLDPGTAPAADPNEAADMVRDITGGGE